jgi:hypothetical protein
MTRELPDPFPNRCLINPRLMSEPPEPPVYLADGLVERGTVLGIAGDSGTSKTTVARALAIAHVRGGTFLGRAVTKGRCVYLHAEDHFRSAVRQLRAMGWCEADTGLHYWCRPPLVLTEDEHRRAVRDELEAHMASLLVLDSASVLSGIDLNDNAGAAEFMSWVGDLADSLDLVAAVVLHENKGNAYAGRSMAAARNAVLGAGQWRAQCHTLISLELPAEPRGTEQTIDGNLDTWTVRVQLPKEREFGDGPEIQGLVKKSLKTDGILRRQWIELDDVPPAPRKKTPGQRMIEALGDGPLGRAELAKSVGMKDAGGFRQALADLRRSEIVVTLDDGRVALAE